MTTETEKKKNPNRRRRKAPAKKNVERMIINAHDPAETRIAIAKGNNLLNLFWEKEHDGLHRGDIVLGKIKHIEKGLQAAFVDLGNDQTGFLHEKNVVLNTKVNKDFLKGKVEGDIPKIGQFVVVQLLKEKYSQKCPTVTMQISIPGRNIVMMPVSSEEKIGVSRKISDDKDRKRLRSMMNEIDLPKDTSFIVRTAGDNATVETLEGDVKYLQRLQSLLASRIKKEKRPGTIYQESDFVLRTIRDTFTDEMQEIIIDDEDCYKRVREFVKSVMPDTLKRIKKYGKAAPIFSDCKIDKQIDQVLQKEVPLTSGGSIVIEPTEAMVTIDVNSGKSHHGANTEETALHTNLEAAVEIARQLRMRDLGGIIAIDFIDLQAGSHRKEVYKKMIELLKDDKARTRGLELSKFCVMQITRQRLGQSLTKYINDPCPSCGGKGYVRGSQTLFPQILRESSGLARSKKDPGVIKISMSEPTALDFSNSRRREILNIEESTQHTIEIIGERGKELDEYAINFYST